MKKYRVAIMTKKGVMSKNCDTREQVDQFILENNASRFRIKDKITNEIIETDAGVVGKNIKKKIY